MGPGLSPISCSSLRISSGEREESSSSYLLVSAAATPLAGRLRGGIVLTVHSGFRFCFVNAQRRRKLQQTITSVGACVKAGTRDNHGATWAPASYVCIVQS